MPRARGTPSDPAGPAGPAGQARADPGQGHLRQLPSGRWQGQVMLGYRSDGTRNVRSVVAPTRREARRALAALVRAHQEGLLGPADAARRPVISYLYGWLEGHQAGLTQASVAGYELAIRRHLGPELAGETLGTLTAERLRTALQRLARRVGPRSVQYAYTTIRLALRQAVRDGLLARNVADAVAPPRRAPAERRALTPEQVHAILAHLDDDWRPLFLLAAYTGLRMGELLGLTWDDVSLERRVLLVRRVLARSRQGGGHMELRPRTKRPASVRAIPLTAAAVDALRLQHAACAQLPVANLQRLVFPTQRGTTQVDSTPRKRFKAAARAAGIPWAHPHLLRHTYASALLAQGRPLPEVAALLGHGSSATTVHIYAHFVEAHAEAAAEAIDRYYRPTSSSS